MATQSTLPGIPAEFEAAVKAQREARIAALRRAAAHFGWQFWTALGFAVLSLGLMIVAQFADAHRSMLPYMGTPIMCLVFALNTALKRRQHAARELAREIVSGSTPA